MDVIETLKNELQTHKVKIIEFQSQMHEVQQTIEELHRTTAELKDKLAFEKGVVQSLEFSITLSDAQGQQSEDK